MVNEFLNRFRFIVVGLAATVAVALLPILPLESPPASELCASDSGICSRLCDPGPYPCAITIIQDEDGSDLPVTCLGPEPSDPPPVD